jgi:hypothetical protein
MERYEQMSEIMKGIIDVKIFGIQNFRYAMFDDIFSWTTIDQGMMDLVMNPGYLHAAADRYVKCFMHRAKQYEDLGLISSNNNNSLIGNGCYGYSNELSKPTENGIGGKLSDNWGVTQDQIFTTVSPSSPKNSLMTFNPVDEFVPENLPRMLSNVLTTESKNWALSKTSKSSPCPRLQTT